MSVDRHDTLSFLVSVLEDAMRAADAKSDTWTQSSATAATAATLSLILVGIICGWMKSALGSRDATNCKASCGCVMWLLQIRL